MSETTTTVEKTAELPNVTVKITEDDVCKETGTKQSDVTNVPVQEIVSVCPYTWKNGPKDRRDGFTLCYVKHRKKCVLKRTNCYFLTDVDATEAWIQKIQGQIDSLALRPRRSLVIVNPVSGQKKGPKVCKKIVEPIFKEANIQADIIVTEKAHHTEEILSHYDLKSIDSLVLVGGDGLYHEAVNGLQTRFMTEAGLDMDRPESEVQKIHLPIGIVPCGTGNGIADNVYGCKDVETAVLAIMMGKRTPTNMFSVFSGGKLIAYSSLLIGYGLFGDLIYVAENRRSSLGVMRYPVTMIEYILFRAGRRMNLTVDYLSPAPVADAGGPSTSPGPPDAPSTANPNRAPSETPVAASPNQGPSDTSSTASPNRAPLETPVAASPNKGSSDTPHTTDSNQDTVTQTGSPETKGVPLSGSSTDPGEAHKSRDTATGATGTSSTTETASLAMSAAPDTILETPQGACHAAERVALEGGQHQCMNEPTGSWKTVQGVFTMLVVFPGDFVEMMNSDMPRDNSRTRFLLTKPYSRGTTIKLFVSFITKDTSVMNSDKLVHDLVTEYKVRLNDPSDPQSALGIKEHLINIDGEPFTLPEAAYHVRFHPEKIQLFSSVPDPSKMEL